MSLIAEEVSHAYRPGEWVLSGVSLKVGAGESVALLGPSGSGKTTLLSILGLLQTPTHGRLVIDGEARSPRRAGRLRSEMFAWVFQTVNTLRRRTALDNAAVGLLARGVGRGESSRLAAEALAAVGLGEMGAVPVERLSGGELQRVCIARAVAARPRFLLADEPTGQLDRSTSDRVLDALWAARLPETALVIATHDLDAASRCDRVIRLVDGRVVAA
ncbi:MAG: ATP-binding cassette domain-containing protein [Acidimicrobiia bacterium]